MMNELTRLATKPLTRRRFLEGMGAAGAAAALASCGDTGKGVGSLFEDTCGRPAVPAIAGIVVAGSAPHNCGGRCVTKAYVENGVVKRFVTDERPDRNFIDDTGDDPQRRACVKCRAQKGFMYRGDRLLKPLKQVGTRGDLNGFVEISWDQAFTEIAAQMRAIVNDPSKGWRTLHSTYASASSGSFPASQTTRLLDLLGGQMTYRQSYSYPGYDQVGRFVLGGSERYQQGNPRQDLFNADQIILWSMNPGDTVMGTNSMWYLEQAKEMGKQIISIDTFINQTTAAVATQKVMVVPGTDAALIAGMMYHLIKTPGLLDFDFIKKYVHGFFDDVTPTLYHPADGPAPAELQRPGWRLALGLHPGRRPLPGRQPLPDRREPGRPVEPGDVGLPGQDRVQLHRSRRPAHRQDRRHLGQGAQDAGVGGEDLRRAGGHHPRPGRVAGRPEHRHDLLGVRWHPAHLRAGAGDLDARRAEPHHQELRRQRPQLRLLLRPQPAAGAHHQHRAARPSPRRASASPSATTPPSSPPAGTPRPSRSGPSPSSSGPTSPRTAAPAGPTGTTRR